MNYRKQIEIHLKESGGIITSAYCRENNIPTVYLSRLAKEGKLFRVQKGIYIIEDGDFDEYYFFQYQYGKAIFSYETALFLLGVTDKIPWRIDVTVYNGYKFNEKQDTLNINYVKKSIYNLGIIQKKTMFGNIVNVYSYERILCDFISNKEKMDTEVYVKLIRSYSKYKDKDIHSLYEIARKMGIEDKVREVMEVVYE
ncbi:abortive infection protein AbiGI [Finegoldia magna SY403409CC001050417]|uniref:Type IV toxin-antitoxin system AbiEi family antitoxin domain-containing protein n=1 Tax=Finegoldia magna TaxID=1260 RepID=A0A7D4FIN7_FINMA|nr:type IV toxin-antitoxin system AbiEi family antitoxin domain-containing protein [Finegoldia magna]HEO0015609.1 type IV toxin-antitoxin system AbiEi family antitoxin domain-containing protein [Streptococcus agalactiae]EGS31993.1 abortive infection protein AbiGI [Finegoldia magna SY403409CC001050417]MDU5699277.1 type IV toxin-antitoxin system AbiEi family antitoxin domain-containing protein [Finegoldia magna]MDU5808783.1 type IV toxin-antitoxin system AbiEi family antitoxin domain-containing p